MTLRDRTPQDPPMVDRALLIQKLEELRSVCWAAQADMEYLPHEPGIDEQYKVDRTLVSLPDIDEAIGLAQRLQTKIDGIRASLRWTVKGIGEDETGRSLRT